MLTELGGDPEKLPFISTKRELRPGELKTIMDLSYSTKICLSEIVWPDCGGGPNLGWHDGVDNVMDRNRDPREIRDTFPGLIASRGGCFHGNPQGQGKV